jgi:hypothetical protein
MYTKEFFLRGLVKKQARREHLGAPGSEIELANVLGQFDDVDYVQSTHFLFVVKHGNIHEIMHPSFQFRRRKILGSFAIIRRRFNRTMIFSLSTRAELRRLFTVVTSAL